MSARDAFRRHAALWRTRSFLQSAAPDPNRAARALARLSAEARAVAAHNPDHSEAGRALAAHGAQPETLPDAVGVAPGWLTQQNVEQGPRVFFGLDWRLRRLLAFPIWILIVLAIFQSISVDQLSDAALARGVARGVITQAQIDQATQGEGGASTLLSSPAMAPLATDFAAQDAVLQGIVDALLAVFVIWALAVMFRRRPARILLLRRFNSNLVEQRIRPFVTRTLAPYGHVYTLADKYFKQTLLGSIMTFNPAEIVLRYLMGVWDFFRGRWSLLGGSTLTRIFSAGQFRSFCLRLNDRVNANGVTMTNKRRSIIVRTSDKWWKHVVLVLMRSSDAIVMDLSDAGAGSDWEIDTLRELGLLTRTVFVAHEDATRLDAQMLDWLANARDANPLAFKIPKGPGSAEARAVDTLSRHDLAQTFIHKYRRSGAAEDRAGFTAALTSAIAAGVRAKSAASV